MRESVIQNQIRVELSKQGLLVFRTNAGEYWQGKRVMLRQILQFPNQPVLINLHKVDGLPKGFSDLLCIGQNQTAFIETKNETGKPTPEQLKFIARMQSLGHAAGVARSVQEAVKIIESNRY